jgi:hypothetical protein
MGLRACLYDLEKRKVYCQITALTTLPKFISFKKRPINCTSRKLNETTIPRNPVSGQITIKVIFNLEQATKVQKGSRVLVLLFL